MRLSILLVGLVLTFHVTMAQEWDLSKIGDQHKWSFRMSKGGDSLGYSVWEIKKLGAQYVLMEDSHVPGFKEEIYFYANASNLEPDSVLITGKLNGFPIEVKARIQSNEVKGYANMPKHPSRPTVSLDQELPEGAKMRFISFVLSPFYKDLKVGMSFSYPQFNSMDGQVRTIEAKVTAEESIEVIGQMVKALKLELSGGVAEQNVYIDPVTTRIVKINFRNIDWVYELIADR